MEPGPQQVMRGLPQETVRTVLSGFSQLVYPDLLVSFHTDSLSILYLCAVEWN